MLLMGLERCQGFQGAAHHPNPGAVSRELLVPPPVPLLPSTASSPRAGLAAARRPQTRRGFGLQGVTDVRSKLAGTLPRLRGGFPKCWLWRGRWGNSSRLPARPRLAAGPPEPPQAGESLEQPARLCQRCLVLSVRIPVERGFEMSFPIPHPPQSQPERFLRSPCHHTRLGFGS